VKQRHHKKFGALTRKNSTQQNQQIKKLFTVMSFTRRPVSVLLKSPFRPSSLAQLMRAQQYHVTRKAENSLIVGGIAVAVAAVSLQYAIGAYHQFTANKPTKPEGDVPNEAADATAKATADSTAEEGSASKKASEKKSAPGSSGSATSMFETWFAKNFYDGGFEEKMSRREAALVLGIRESATPERIKEAHRRILLLNHPDRGGSAHLAAKINEAKDLLIKGKQ
jgi:DnaJ homolog subfamily C member 19